MASKVEIAMSMAKAKVSVRRRKAAREEADETIVGKVMSWVRVPEGKAGRDAPEMSEILDKIVPLLPEPKIVQNTIVQKIDEGDFRGMVQAMLDAQIPDIAIEDRPVVEHITMDVSDEKLEGFVTKEEMDKHLIRIQRAIQSSSGGGGSSGDLANVIQVFEDTTITSEQLLAERYNVILIMTAGITVTLPIDDGTKIIEIKQGFTGAGTYTICKESS